MSLPFIPFWQRIFFSMAYGTMTWISSERIQPKHRKQEGTFLEGPTAILRRAVVQSKPAPVNWRWSGRPPSSRGPVEDGSDMMGQTFSFLFTLPGSNFSICVLMVEMVELLFHWVVQFRSVQYLRAFFICSFKAGRSIKMTDLYCPCFWHHSTRTRRCRDGARRIWAREAATLCLTTVRLCFSVLKVCVWQHVHLHSWSYWRVTLHKAATRSLHSWSWSRCYIENTGRISQDLGACSTLAHRAGLNWTANWEYGIHLDQKHLGCLFSNFSSVSSQLIATLFRYLWPALGSANSACCGPSCAAPATGSSGWCFPLSSLLSPRLPPLPPFVPLAWRCS